MLSRSVCLSLLQESALPLDRKATAWLRRGERLGHRLEVIRDTLARSFAPLRPGWPAPRDLWPVQVQQLRGGLDPAMSYAGQLRMLSSGEVVERDPIAVRRPELDNTIAFARSVSEVTARVRPGSRRRDLRLVGTAAAESARVWRKPRSASRPPELAAGPVVQSLANASTSVNGETTVAA